MKYLKQITVFSLLAVSILGFSPVNILAQSEAERELPILVKYKNQDGVKKQKGKQRDMDKMRGRSDVEFVEIDSIQTPQIENVTYQEAAVNAPLAWAKMTAVTNKVLVAVCDTGVESSHPDLQANLRKDLGFDVYNNSPLGWDVVQHPHGTMVSGVIAATAGNDIGTRGVAVGVEIMPLKMTFDSTGSAYVSTMAACIRYAADKGAKVVNVSFSGMTSFTIQDAASYAMKKNTNVFFAMGNENRIMTEKNNVNIIAVGATDSNNQKAVFTNTGRPVDIVVPGVAILTTTTGGGYATVSGTSFSSPITAGIIGMARAKDNTLTAAKVVTNLPTYGNDLGVAGYDTTFGYGIINADKVVN
jgi:thermitase